MTAALITGANKGIGFEVARLLGQREIKVWLGARSEERGRTAQAALRSEGSDVEFVPLDVRDERTIHVAADRIASSSATLDILVNHAGMMNEFKTGTLEPILPSQVSTLGMRELYNINFFGAIAVTQVFLPLLRRSLRARIVNVSTRFGSFGHQTYENWPPRAVTLLGYATSKAALNTATVLFAEELRGTPIKTNAVTPGTIATDLRGIPAKRLGSQWQLWNSRRGRSNYVKYALLPDSGPSGGFFGLAGELPW